MFKKKLPQIVNVSITGNKKSINVFKISGN